MDKLGAMRAFVEIADQGSLTAAGRVLDRSLPTMVRTLASLEEALETRLFRRTTRRISLTEEGRTYLASCRRILTEVDEAEGVLLNQAPEPRGEIRMTAPVAFGHWHVAAAVNEFLDANRGVSVDLLLLDRVVDLVQEGIDVGVRIGELHDSSMVAVPVGSMRRVVVASPALLETCAPLTHPEQLAALPCVRFRGLTAGSSWQFRVHGRHHTVTVNGPLVCNHAPTSVEACVAGLGFGTFLAYQIEPWVRDGRLQVVLSEYEYPPLPVSLIYADPRLPSARLRVFVDWMKQRLRSAMADLEAVG